LFSFGSFSVFFFQLPEQILRAESEQFDDRA
jgi:hypothetical protein